MRIHCIRVEVSSSGLFCHPRHHAHSILIAGCEPTFSSLSIANGKNWHVLGLSCLNGRHHVMRAGIVLSVAEDQQCPPALLMGQLLCYRVVDGVVERCTKYTILGRTDFGKSLVSIIELSQAIQQDRSGLREITHQAQVVPKADQKSAVIRPKNISQENLQIMTVSFIKMLLAVAEVDNQAKSQRDIGTAR